MSKKAINLTVKELTKILFDTKLTGVTFASVLQNTSPKCTKKSRITGEPNPFTTISKISKVGIILNSEYELAVINQLGRENKEAGEYQQGVNTMPLQYGENNIFIGLFNGEPVLQYRPNDNVKPQTVYFADGKRTSKEQLEQYLPVPSKPNSQGSIEKVVMWRKLYLSNVLRLSLNGKTYNVIG